MNNMDRIQINGVWYVREDQQEESIVLDPANYHGCVVENNEFCIEATKTLKDDGDYYDDDINIKFSDKRSKPWKEEHWDHIGWMRGVLNNVPASLEQLPDIGPKGIKFLRAFLKHLEDRKWL